MYTRPTTVDDALELLGEPNAVVVSGGTDFYPQRLNRSRVGIAPEHIVDVSGLDELRGIVETPTGWRIGARTTWTAISCAGLPPMFDGLRSAAHRIGGTQIQNVATVAGNLCTASPAADGMPPLLTLDPVVELRSLNGTRHLPLVDFVTGYRTTALLPGELVTALDIPAALRSGPADPAAGLRAGSDEPHVRSAFVKLGSRAYLVISIAMVAALLVVEHGSIAEARVAVGSCSPVARRMTSLERSLVGSHIDDVVAIEEIVRSAELDGLAPIDDVRAAGDYRASVVPRLIVDAIVSCRTPFGSANESSFGSAIAS